MIYRPEHRHVWGQKTYYTQPRLAPLRQGEATELLAPVYDWFTEGFDTADLKDAKTFLKSF